MKKNAILHASKVSKKALISSSLSLILASSLYASEVYTIESGSLKDAVKKISKISNMKFMADSRLLEGKKASAIKNINGVEKALKEVLKDTDLEAVIKDNIIIIKKKKVVSKWEQKRSERLEDLVVTANKVEENVQEVPISITVFDEFTIEDRKIESIEDVAEYTSNFTLIDRGAGIFVPSVRGMSTQPVSVIIDGIPVSDHQGFNISLIDIERIEVLKGPQSTLYGKDAQAGVINVITKKPDNETRGKVGAEFGSDNKKQYTLLASGPIVKDKLFVGLSAKHYEKDGFIKDMIHGGYVNDRENDYGRLHLRYTPSDELEISLISSKKKENSGDIAYLGREEGYKSKNVDMQGYDKSDTTTHALKISYDIDDYLFESISTYRNIDLNQLQTYSWGGYHFLRDGEKSSQEFRLSNSSGFFKWVTGVYAEKVKHIDTSYMVGMSIAPSTTKSDSLGIFIHTDYTINNKLSFISGVRYDKVNNSGSLSDNEISPKVSLKYQQDKNSMYYATISKGYRQGGQNIGSGPSEYDSETLWNYEIGAKTTFFDNRLTVNSSIFYMKIDDMQVKVRTSPNTRESYTDNAAKATSKGFEVGVSGKLTDSLELFGSYGFTDVTLDEYRDAKGDYSGNKKTYAPDYNYNIGIQYRDAKGYFARVDLNGEGKMYFDNANKLSRDAYKLVNAKIGYEADSYDIYLYGKNIFDKEYNSVGMFNFGGTKYSQPREIGVQLAYRF